MVYILKSMADVYLNPNGHRGVEFDSGTFR